MFGFLTSVEEIINLIIIIVNIWDLAVGIFDNTYVL